MSVLAENRASMRQAAAAINPTRVSIALVVAATFLMVHLATGNSDISWLLTLGERWLNGERPYIDFIEVNPPASILLYLPAVALSRWIGVPPEGVTTVLVVVAALLSLSLSGGALLRAGLIAPRCRDGVAVVALVLALLMPAGNFGEREHVAALASLPMLAFLASRSVGVVPTTILALLAGLGGGIAMAIKPMFALGFVGPVGYLLVRQGWRRTLRAWELHTAWIVTGLYGAAVLLFFPGFTQTVLHWVLVAYVPVRSSVRELLTSPLTLTWIGFAGTLAMVSVRARRNPAALVLALSSVGYQAVFLLQAKDWAYQALAAALLMALAVVLQAAQPQAGPSGSLRRPLRLAAIGLAGLLGINTALCSNVQNVVEMVSPGLTAAIQRVAPHPRLMTITMDLVVGHPLVRVLGGRWVGSFSSNWLTTGLRLLQHNGGLSSADEAELQDLSAREKAITVSDIVDRKPDVILIQTSWDASYVSTSESLLRALTDYAPQGTFGPLQLWVRKVS